MFSRALFCYALKNKTADEVQKAFRKIFEKAGLKPEKLETDQGSEFKGNRHFFEQQKIFFKVKIGRNKASFAEYGIHLVKTRLFRLLRTLRSQDWPRYLPDVVHAINHSSNSAIGGLFPSDIKKPTDGPKIDQAIGLPKDVPFQKQILNQKRYEQSQNKKKIKKNDFVFVDFGPAAMAKGYDSPVMFFAFIKEKVLFNCWISFQNYQIFEVKEVDAGKDPVLFTLQDQMGATVPGNLFCVFPSNFCQFYFFAGHYYREQLTKTSPPEPGKSYRIEYIITEKDIKGKPYALVKFLHYPAKFNKWLPLENFVK